MLELKQLKEKQHDSGITFTFFIMWSFILLCRPQDYLSFVGYLRPAFVLGFLSFFVWTFSAKSEGTKVPIENQMKLYSCLILVMILSIPFSYYPRGSLKGMINYSSVILFVFLFYRLMNSAEKIRRILFVYTIGIAVYGLAILTKGILMEGRIYFGTMFDPNDIAFYMISFLTFNLLFISNDNTAKVRLISLASLLIGLFIIIKTGSRGGFLALSAVLVFFLFKRSAAFNISVLQKGMLVLLALITLQFTALDMGRFMTIMDYRNEYNVTSEEGRIAIWKSGMKIMATHPVFGVGFNRFPESIGRDREARGLDSVKWQTAHNSLVEIGAETGIIGFILFLALSLKAYRIFGGISREEIGLAKLGVVAQAGFIGHFISAMFLSQAYSVYWAFYIVLSGVLHRISEKKQP